MFDTFSLPNWNICGSEIPEDIYNSIMCEIKEIGNGGSSNTYNHRLAGAIEREFELLKSRSSFVPFLEKMATEYSHARTKKLKNIEFKVGEIWVNFQQKNEYNPIHNHTGDLSFVLWMEIPFKHLDECSVKNTVNSNSAYLASSFEFVYTDILGAVMTHTLPVEKGWERRIVMFPAGLHHVVYPFYTSDGYRISVSGNLIIKKMEE